MPGFGNIPAGAGGGASGGGGFLGGMGGFDFGSLMGLLGGGGQQQQFAPVPIPGIPPTGGTELGNPEALSQALTTNNPFSGTLEEVVTPPASENTPPPQSFADRAAGFVDNLDNTLQSPAKVAGLGLLGEIDPRLVYAGLLAAGLFDKEGGN